MKTIIVAICFFILGMFFEGKFFSVKPSTPDNQIPSIEQQTELKEQKQMPWLDLPLDYFSDKNIQWGSVKNHQGDKVIDYSQVALDNLTVYQSYPSLNITITDFSSEKKPLISKSIETILQDYRKNQLTFDDEIIRENFNTYGVLATNYLPITYITKLKQLDVDNDGQKEKIVVYNFVGSADSGSYQSDIIKGPNIIFSVQEDNAEIIPAETDNGFYVEWVNEEFGIPRCCAEGKMRTRFVWQDNKFVPVYEQEVRFLKVGKKNN